MDIVKEHNNELEATIRVKLTEDDYSEQFDKELKSIQKKAQMPGFRPGKVPMGLIKKMYGKTVMAEEVNKIMTDELLKYIKDENLEIMGGPLPDAESTGVIDWDQEKEFEFHYLVGLKPAIDLELSPEIEVDYHKIKVKDEEIDKYIEEARRRNGDFINPDVAEEDDVLMGEFAEVDEEHNPIEGGKVNRTNLFIKFIRDEEVKGKLVGAKAGTQVIMDVLKAVESETEAASMIGIKKEELLECSPVFRFTVDSISRIVPAELNEEFFEKFAPGKEIKSEEALRAFVAGQISEQYQREVDRYFSNMVSEELIERAKLPLPENFLKKWLLENNREELTTEKIEDEFAQAADAFRWQIIQSHLLKKYNIEVKPEEVNQQLELFIRSQMAQYGQTNIPQEIMDKYVKELGSKEEEVNKVYDHLVNDKLVSLYKEKLGLIQKEISLEDFTSMLSEKYKSVSESDASGTGTDAPADTEENPEPETN